MRCLPISSIVDDALAAGDARHGIERSLKRRADVSVKSAGVCADNGDVLSLTCCDAAAAENALAVVSYHMNSGIVVFVNGICTVEAPLVVNAELLAELLELAGSAADARETFSVMRRKNELESRLAALADALGVCEYLHTLVNGVHAGGHERTRALDLDHADAAGADLVEVLDGADLRIEQTLEDQGHTLLMGRQVGHDLLLASIGQLHLDKSLVEADTLYATLGKDALAVHVVELVLDRTATAVENQYFHVR